MAGARTSENMSPGLLRVMERARRNPRERQFSLAYLIDVDALRQAYGRIRKEAAVGVDGVTKERYGQDLERNLTDLHERLKAMRYRHQPIRRVHIAKDKKPEAADRDIMLGGQDCPGCPNRDTGCHL